MLTNRTHKHACALLCALLMLLTLPGCSCTADAEEPSAVAPSSPEPEPESPVEPAPQTGEREVPVFLIAEGLVSPVSRTIEVELDSGEFVPDDDPSTVEALVETLLEGPTAGESALGFASSIPAGTRLNAVAVSAGLVTVDLSPEFEAGGDSQSILQRTAQIVFSLTELDGVEQIAFRIEGADLKAGAVRDDFNDVRPALLITTPLPEQSITSPVTVRGESNTFEATFLIEVIDPAGQVITEQFVSGGGGTGTWAEFSAPIEFDAAEGAGFVVAYERSAKDGSRIHETRVPVVFE